MILIKRTHLWTPLAFTLLILTGCRTYGGSTNDQLEASLITASEQIVAEAQMFINEAQMLSEAAMRHPELIPFSEKMHAINSEYIKMMEKHKKLVDEVQQIRDFPITNWIANDRYRALHRAYGALITERELKHRKRSYLLTDLSAHLGLAGHQQSVEEGRLQIRPHYYNRSWSVTDLQDLLAMMDNSVS
ncbi:MAG: hypothetical protein OXF06_04795 [Bacteroidetes bacterium]|nr:hypothetical protein [Bacteroidota bacterium]